MNPKEKLKELINKQKALLDKVKTEGRVFTDEENTQFNAWQKEVDNCTATIKAEEELAKTEDFAKAPASTVIDAKPKNSNPKPFKNLGEQLQAIQKAAMSPNDVDPRLREINNAASGSNTGNGPDGGFMIQTDFGGSIIDSAFKESGLLQMCDTYDISENANGVEFKEIDETDISSTVYGGVQSYWAAEAETVTSSKPKFAEHKIELAKLMGIGYATDETMQDTNFMGQLYSRAFTASIMKNLESSIISGDGKGKPLGILNSTSLVSVAKVTNQTADTLVHKNIVQMWLRGMWTERKNMAWIIHPDVEEQLELMIFDGSTSNPIPLYMPAGGLTNDTALARMKGRPVILTDACSALGDKGDIILANMKDYIIIRKGGIQEAQSLAVRFLYGENTFRFTFRVNGRPRKKSALTIKNSTNTRSSFVTLDAR